MVTIRRAVADDLEFVKDCGREFSQAVGMPWAWNEDYARRTLIPDLIENHLALIAEDDGHQVGVISGFDTVHPFNPEVTLLAEVVWWVMPEGRAKSAGKKLLDEFIAIGKEFDIITMSTLNNPVHDRMLERIGFVKSESGFVMVNT